MTSFAARSRSLVGALGVTLALLPSDGAARKVKEVRLAPDVVLQAGSSCSLYLPRKDQGDLTITEQQGSVDSIEASADGKSVTLHCSGIQRCRVPQDDAHCDDTDYDAKEDVSFTLDELRQRLALALGDEAADHKDHVGAMRHFARALRPGDLDTALKLASAAAATGERGAAAGVLLPYLAASPVKQYARILQALPEVANEKVVSALLPRGGTATVKALEQPGKVATSPLGVIAVVHPREGLSVHDARTGQLVTTVRGQEDPYLKDLGFVVVANAEVDARSRPIEKKRRGTLWELPATGLRLELRGKKVALLRDKKVLDQQPYDDDTVDWIAWLPDQRAVVIAGSSGDSDGPDFSTSVTLLHAPR